MYINEQTYLWLYMVKLTLPFILGIHIITNVFVIGQAMNLYPSEIYIYVLYKYT